ncbi:MAG: hypothetical protein ACJAQ3_001123 [Planctomycetota bacterium]|jgi:hypothetical protein
MGSGALASIALAALVAPASAYPQESGLFFEETFQEATVGSDGSILSKVGRFLVEGEGTLEVMHPRDWSLGELALRLPGGVENTTVLEVAPGAVTGGSVGGTLEFACQRDGRKQPFALNVTLIDRDGVETLHQLNGQVNGKARRELTLAAPPALTAVRFSVTAPAARGVWIDDVRLVPPTPMQVSSTKFDRATRPLILGETVDVGFLEIFTTGSLDPLELAGPVLTEVRGHGASPDELAGVMARFEVVAPRTSEGRIRLASGRNRFPVRVNVKVPMAVPKDGAAAAEGAASMPPWSQSTAFILGYELREEAVMLAPDEPGLARASWPAVRVTAADSDARAVSLVALPARGEVAEVLLCAVTLAPQGLTLQRSVTGGATWAPTALPEGAEALAGGSLVHDLETREVHLLGERDSRLQMSSSKDGGATWSDWRVLEDLGSKRIGAAGSTGITVSTGTLAVPVIVYGGFRIEDEACAGLIVSEDHGVTWAMHHAAFPNTTTSAVAEIGPGALLLSMTDGRGALRSERTTRDLGRTWERRLAIAATELHKSAGSDGALIHLGRARGLGWDSRLVFANASTNKMPLRDLMLKGSSDNTSHWPSAHHVLLDDGVGVDHPALCPVGRDEVGIAYECSAGGVVFQRLPELVVVPKVGSWFDVSGAK